MQYTREERAAIGSRLRSARERAGLTQQETAQVVGVSRATVANWEAGRNLPSVLQFRDLLVQYGASSYEILFGYPRFCMTRAEIAELARATESFSPSLQGRIAVLLTIVSQVDSR